MSIWGLKNGSSFSGKTIDHRLLREARQQMLMWASIVPNGKIVVLVGPTQAGKSHVYREVVDQLKSDFRDERPGAKPVVHLQIENVEDGRMRTKWLVIELLKFLEHPVYKHIGDLDELERYAPSRGRDETTLRIALKRAFDNRFTQRICLDEAHLLTQTKSSEVRSAILESIKSMGAVERTLFLFGGYELAYQGIFDSPHFSGRLIFVDFGHYNWTHPLDAQEWQKICKTYSKYLDLSPKSLLADHAHYLADGSCGVIGQLDTWLLQCRSYSRLKSVPVTLEILRMFAPSRTAVQAIMKDIKLGKSALDRLQPQRPQAFASSAPEKAGSTAPFTRAPNRNSASKVIVDE